MAFAKRKLPLVVGAEAAGEIAAVGDGVTALQGRRSGGDVWRADLRRLQGLPRGPRQSVRERRRHHGLPRRRLRARARSTCRRGSSSRCRRACGMRDAACAPIAFATVQHMLFDNAKLQAGRDHPGAGRRLRHRHGRDQDGEGDRLHRHHHRRRRRQGGEGQGARRRSRHQLPQGAVRDHHAQAHRQEGRRRGVRACRRREASTARCSCLKRGGRLVTCGSTSGPIDHAST